MSIKNFIDETIESTGGPQKYQATVATYDDSPYYPIIVHGETFGDILTLSFSGSHLRVNEGIISVRSSYYEQI